MYNKVILMGRICNALKLKTTPSGVSVLTFRIAVDANYASKGEERKTFFFSAVAWRNTAEFIAKYFEKGRMIMVDGELQTRSYTDKSGVAREVTEIVVGNAHFTGELKTSTQSQPREAGYGNAYAYGAPPPGSMELPQAKQHQLVN
jgi:single-strand DNA-binding protein